MPTTDEQVYDHYCVPSAIRDAWTYEIRTGRQSRMAVTKIDENANRDHVQAEGQLPDGSWIPLTTHNSDGKLRTWERHFPDKEPYRYVPLDQFVEEQGKVRRKE